MDTESEPRKRNKVWKIRGRRKRSGSGGGADGGTGSGDSEIDSNADSNYDDSSLNDLDEDEAEESQPEYSRPVFRKPKTTFKDDSDDDNNPPRPTFVKPKSAMLSKDDSYPILKTHSNRMRMLKEKKDRVAHFRRKRAKSDIDDISNDGSEFTDKGTRDGIRASFLKRIPLNKLRRGGKKNGISTGDGKAMDGSIEYNPVSGAESTGYATSDDGAPSAVSFDLSALQRSGSMRSFDTGLDADYAAGKSLEGGGRSIEGDSFHVRGERARYSIHHGKRGGKRKFRVRPYHCFDEPCYMTEEDIYSDSLKPSKDFDFLQSYLEPSFRLSCDRDVPEEVSNVWGSPEDDGRIGAFRVEVLGCISLGRTKPDVCVYVVCGDSVFTTDVLTGYRSPMWPHNSKRAAVFPIHHAYAKVYVSVFDVRVRKNSENDVFCGRVVLDVAALRPDTDYDVTLPLRYSSFIYDRKPRGVIRIRFGLHWFNERAAVVSYLKSPKSMARGCPLVHGQPTIPCADPKTFRNLAVTVYGHDLPGKYSRDAFRATMREFNLYQQNVRQMVKILVLDAVMYEKPLVSLYLFVAGMHCALSSSVQMVPPFFVGYLLILLVLNHQHFVQRTSYNLGYKPLTLLEIAKGFFLHYKPETPNFNQIFLQKRTKQRRMKSKGAQQLRRLESDEGNENKEEVEILPLDHREFPFADRDAYPKLSVEDAVVMNSKGSRRGTIVIVGFFVCMCF